MLKRRQEKNGVYHSRDWTEHGSLDPYPGQLNTLANPSYGIIKSPMGSGACCRRKGEFQWYQDT